MSYCTPTPPLCLSLCFSWSRILPLSLVDPTELLRLCLNVPFLETLLVSTEPLTHSVHTFCFVEQRKQGLHYSAPEGSKCVCFSLYHQPLAQSLTHCRCSKIVEKIMNLWINKSSFDIKVLPGSEIFLPTKRTQRSKVSGNILLQTPPAPPTNIPRTCHQLDVPGCGGPRRVLKDCSDFQWPVSPGWGVTI